MGEVVEIELLYQTYPKPLMTHPLSYSTAFHLSPDSWPVWLIGILLTLQVARSNMTNLSHYKSCLHEMTSYQEG